MECEEREYRYKIFIDRWEKREGGIGLLLKRDGLCYGKDRFTLDRGASAPDRRIADCTRGALSGRLRRRQATMR